MHSTKLGAKKVNTELMSFNWQDHSQFIIWVKRYLLISSSVLFSPICDFLCSIIWSSFSSANFSSSTSLWRLTIFVAISACSLSTETGFLSRCFAPLKRISNFYIKYWYLNKNVARVFNPEIKGIFTQYKNIYWCHHGNSWNINTPEKIIVSTSTITVNFNKLCSFV